jgi:hypothetical protein
MPIILSCNITFFTCLGDLGQCNRNINDPSVSCHPRQPRHVKKVILHHNDMGIIALNFANVFANLLAKPLVILICNIHVTVLTLATLGGATEI